MSYASEVLADAPAAWYRCNESSGLIQDSSGNARNATVAVGTATYSQPGAITTDPSNNAIYFDAEPTYFTVPDVGVDLGNIWSIECWIKRAAIGGVGETLVSKGLQAYEMGLESDSQIFIAAAGDATLANSTIAISDTTSWHHVVGTKNAAVTKIYIDNIECSQNNIEVTTIDNATALFIGDSAFTGNPVNARLDEIAIYGTELSAARVSAHYTAAFSHSPADDFPIRVLGQGRGW